MKIAAGTLFFGLSVFLHSIELIKSQRDRAKTTTLEKLFPESEGLHFPRIEELNQETVQSLRKFQKLNGRPMVKQAETYLKRGDVIIGYLEEDEIKLLGVLFGQPTVYAVFKFTIEKQQWYTLSSYDDIVKLGVSRSLIFVRAHDDTHAMLHELNYKENRQAHNAASEAAYIATRVEEEPLRIQPLFDVDYGAASIRNRYIEIYNEEYARQKEIQKTIQKPIQKPTTQQCGGRCSYL